MKKQTKKTEDRSGWTPENMKKVLAATDAKYPRVPRIPRHDLEWLPDPEYPRVINATIGVVAEQDSVRFTIQNMPTCYRRGPFQLMIEVVHGPMHERWGCFDEADQPLRWFHDENNAKDEAAMIAAVLMKDRYR